jgi:hypothetical protein
MHHENLSRPSNKSLHTLHKGLENFNQHLMLMALCQTVMEIRSLNYIFKKNETITLKGKGKAIPVTGREGPQGCETLKLPHFL